MKINRGTVQNAFLSISSVKVSNFPLLPQQNNVTLPIIYTAYHISLYLQEQYLERKAAASFIQTSGRLNESLCTFI